MVSLIDACFNGDRVSFIPLWYVKEKNVQLTPWYVAGGHSLMITCVVMSQTWDTWEKWNAFQTVRWSNVEIVTDRHMISGSWGVASCWTTSFSTYSLFVSVGGHVLYRMSVARLAKVSRYSPYSFIWFKGNFSQKTLTSSAFLAARNNGFCSFRCPENQVSK